MPLDSKAKTVLVYKPFWVLVLQLFLDTVMAADLRTMLAWGLPPILIMAVLLLRFTSDGIENDSIDFAELFSGAGELSKALRSATWLQILVFN